MRKRLFIISALAAMFLIIPSELMAKKKPQKGVAIVAHRGYWNCEAAGYAKNSLAALKCAQEAGFWKARFAGECEQAERLFCGIPERIF